jgi:hypothetical protein
MSDNMIGNGRANTKVGITAYHNDREIGHTTALLSKPGSISRLKLWMSSTFPITIHMLSPQYWAPQSFSNWLVTPLRSFSNDSHKVTECPFRRSQLDTIWLLTHILAHPSLFRLITMAFLLLQYPERSGNLRLLSKQYCRMINGSPGIWVLQILKGFQVLMVSVK